MYPVCIFVNFFLNCVLYFSLSTHQRYHLTLNITFCTSTVQEFISTVLHVTMADDSTVSRVFPMAISFTLFSFMHKCFLLPEASSQCVHVMTTFTNDWNVQVQLFSVTLSKRHATKKHPCAFLHKYSQSAASYYSELFHFTGWWSGCCC